MPYDSSLFTVCERPVPLGLVLPLPPPLDQRRDASTGEPERQHDDRGRGDEQIREGHSALTSRPSAASFRGREPRTSPRAEPRGPCASGPRAQPCSSLSRVGANARAARPKSLRSLRSVGQGVVPRCRRTWPRRLADSRSNAPRTAGNTGRRMEARRRCRRGRTPRWRPSPCRARNNSGTPRNTALASTFLRRRRAPSLLGDARRPGALPATRPASRSNVRRDAAMASHGSSPGVRRP